MNPAIQEFNKNLSISDEEICNKLAIIIDEYLNNATSKIWHGHPVWFINDNPIVGYSKQKAGVRLMFWSGMSFDEDQLKEGTGKFKDASIFYTSIDQLNEEDLIRWLQKSIDIQWDYKNIVKRKGLLIRLK